MPKGNHSLKNEQDEYMKFVAEFQEETSHTPIGYIKRQLRHGFTKKQINYWFDYYLCGLIREHYDGRIFTFSEVYKKYEEEEAFKRKKQEHETRITQLRTTPHRSVCYMWY